MSRDPDSGLFGIDRRSLLKGLGVAGVATAVTGSTASAASQGGDRRGPYRDNRFLVEIDGVVTAGFQHVDLPDAAVADVEYREGNDPPSTRKLYGSAEYDPLLLGKGVTDDSIELWEWFDLARQGNLDEARRTVAVVLLSPNGEAGPRWEFQNAWPARYEAPTLDAGGNDVAVETLEILHEGMERTA